jgi:hypothetical protein
MHYVLIKATRLLSTLLTLHGPRAEAQFELAFDRFVLYAGRLAESVLARPGLVAGVVLSTGLHAPDRTVGPDAQALLHPAVRLGRVGRPLLLLLLLLLLRQWWWAR